MPKEIPTKAQIAKLPVWAQEHIKTLERQREDAIRTLKKFTDGNTPTNIFVEEHPCLGEKLATGEKSTSPDFVRHYIQAKRVMFKLPRAEMELEVYVNEEEQRVEFRTPKGYPYIEPHGNNLFHLVPKEDMYLNPNAVTLLQASYEADALSHDAFVKKYGFSQRALPDKIKEVVPKRHWSRAVSG